MRLSLAGSLINSTVCGNTNAGRGGGVVIYPGGGTVQSCLIAKNHGGTTGSGVQFYFYGILRNCTIVGNTGNPGLYFWGSADPGAIIENCIIVSNYWGANLHNWSLNGTLTNLSISNTCTFPTNFNAGVQRSGCISNDPAFVNYSAGNYHLNNNSPCINMGVNQSWMAGATDLDGYRRIDRLRGIVDMGCYEYVFKGTIFTFR